MPLRRWFTDLPRRMAPLLVWVTIVILLGRDALVDTLDLAASMFIFDGWLVAVVAVILLAITLSLAWIAFALVRGLLRRVNRPAGIAVASALIVACLTAVIVTGYTSDPDATVSPVFGALALLAVCALVTGMGGGALISWAARMAVRNASAIGHMASLALPVILMLVVFAFFSAEVWQMATALGWWSITLVGALVGTLAVVVVLRVCASEIDEMNEKLTPEQRTTMLAEPPAANRVLTAGESRPLGIVQRLNILLVMAVAQLLQALFFALLLWGLLVVLGAIAITPGIVEIWVGEGSTAQPLAVDYVALGDTTLPLTVNLMKASALLALIATLPFVFSAVSEERYRERFFDPIMADMRRAIVVRDALALPRRRKKTPGATASPSS